MQNYFSNITEKRLTGKRLKCFYSEDGQTESNFIECEENQYCSLSWYQRETHEKVVTRRACFNPPTASEISNICEHKNCKTIVVNWKDPNIDCTRGPGAICCCNDDFCNNHIPGYMEVKGCLKQNITTMNNDKIRSITNSPVQSAIPVAILVCAVIFILLLTGLAIFRIMRRWPIKGNRSISISREINQQSSKNICTKLFRMIRRVKGWKENMELPAS